MKQSSFPQILANPPSRLEKLLSLAQKAKRHVETHLENEEYYLESLENIDSLEREKNLSTFLDPQKNLLLIERTPEYLKKISKELLKPFLLQGERLVFPKPIYPHHSTPDLELIEILLNREKNKELFFACYRIKGPDSIAEKITRILAKKNSLKPYIIGDVNAITLVTPDEESCYQLREKINNFSFLERIKKESNDFIANPSPSGYRALHETYFWKNGDPTLEEVVFEIHYVPLEDYRKNQEGSPENPQRSHQEYAHRKLQEPHSQNNYQIIILETKEKKSRETNSLISVRPVTLTNLRGEVEYFLVSL